MIQALVPKQYGSQKSKATNIQSLNKQLFYNIIQFNRQMAALGSNNAKSCYDQIVLRIAALEMCRLGRLMNWLRSMVNTLVSMTHHMCMAYGDSKMGQNCTNWEDPMAGIR